MNRRRFFKKGTVSALSILGIDIVFASKIPSNYTPLILDPDNPYEVFAKDKDMVVLNDRPWNIEAQAHLLDDLITPASKMFIRNNGIIPKNINPDTWQLTIDGEAVKNAKTFDLKTLKSKFQSYSYQLTLECGGNGRSEFDPPAKGNQWTIGAVSCAVWKGLRLRDLLDDVGIRENAVYIGYYGADRHLSGDRNKNPISRGIPIEKALQNETLIAYEMNGEPIPLAHGFPLRLVAGGWPASASGKWINRLSIRDKIHDGTKMGGKSYRVPCSPVAPGSQVEDKDMCIIESMPVKSLITYPETGALISNGQLAIRGKAWAGELGIKEVMISNDFGSTWFSASLEAPKNRLAWQAWSAKVEFPKRGYYEIWAKAIDDHGNQQPMVLPGWNPKGYLNNACHRIAIKWV